MSSLANDQIRKLNSVHARSVDYFFAPPPMPRNEDTICTLKVLSNGHVVRT